MVDLPAFFNRIDFVGVYLPGYVAVFAGLIFFEPALLSGFVSSSTPDVFEAVVFLVAGPAVGLTLQQFHRSLGLLWYRARHDSMKDRATLTRFFDGYAEVELKATQQEANALDLTEAYCDFAYSTSIGLLADVIYRLIVPRIFDLVSVAIIVVCVILLLGAYYQRIAAYGPVVNKLLEKYETK